MLIWRVVTPALQRQEALTLPSQQRARPPSQPHTPLL
jgi:hypothetical protein